MREAGLIAALLLAVTSGAGAQQPQTLKADGTSLGRTSGVGIEPQRSMAPFLDADAKYLQCFDEQAARLDDGRSDVRSVAAAIYAACGKAKMAALLTMNFNSQEAVTKAVQATRDQDIDRASIAVLKVRGAKR